MPSGDIHLYFRDLPSTNARQPLGFGRFSLKAASALQSNGWPHGLRLSLENLRSFDLEGQDARWVGLWAWVEDSMHGGETVFGRILMESGNTPPRPDLSSSVPTNFEWTWLLSAQDIEIINGLRGQNNPGTAVVFRLRIQGIVQMGPTVAEVRSFNDQIQFAASEWDDLASRMGYGGAPASLSGFSTSSETHWKDAETRLTEAWATLRRGEARDALGDCLQRFEALVSAPYTKDAWHGYLTRMPDQKGDALEGLLGAFCTYLNRVGHHRSRTDRDAAGDFAEMPADQWEGELGVGMAQLLLTYALRMAGSR